MTDVSAQSPAHGIAGWPHGPVPAGPGRPDRLPDGRPWPRIRIVTPAGPEAAAAQTVASVLRQGYPDLRHDLLPRGGGGIAARLLDDADTDAVLWLRAGDLLAPGALAALALERALTGLAAVGGLRVLFRDRVLRLDAPSLLEAPLFLDVPSRTGAEVGPLPFTGGEVLWSRAALAGAATLDADGRLDAAAAWATLPPGTRGRIGRPTLLQRAPDAVPEPPAGLSIVSLTGLGTVGGAGVAQGRLADALALSGHRVAQVSLGRRPAAAEWTDAFPPAETAIAALEPDLVLAGNLHGATRSLDAVGRLAGICPVALVLHDLFPLTGRCCHPRGCDRAETGCDAACPGPDEYPQLAPRRIAGMHARKRAVLAGPRPPWLLANSDWTLARARALAPPGAASPDRIGLAFPTGVFRPPDDRAALRRRLGLPADDVLILVSSVIVDGPDKGFPDLRAALRAVDRPGVGVVAVGRLDDPAKLGVETLFAPGLVGDEAELAAWYGACDLHVTASRHETLGQTPIEAGLCGVPTLAYRTAGLTSAVIDGVSGRLVPPVPGALAEALAALVADAEARARLGAFARIVLESRFSPAAAALRLDDLLRARGLIPDGAGRPSFAPAMLGHFPFAAERLPGLRGTVAAASPRIVRRLRRAKQMVLGRTLPLVLRRCLYLADRLRSAR
ncbi:glycosyltransferase [Methylobacterium sp. NEAU 140]|uniref:glycosyltransferase n=1 Tax=Methylobacterium sp. NEAU 140 TaxID=3064945 RepID=UPI00273754ED|nr:glycosyltransferase [Methylobacterium sp. NEAU 140]MDP4021219.1 glycosyltransferase [Methylobacterium sp. NEAU 140]